MLAKLFSGTIIGLSGILIEVEVDVANRGFPVFTIVGLPNKAIDEAKDRVRTAIVNSGYEMPDSRITVNLAPADIPKMGSGFDLPIALGLLAASGAINPGLFTESLFVGELSLHGQLRAVPGIISTVLMAKEKNIKQIFLPKENAAQAMSVEDIEVYPLDSLSQLVDHLNGEKAIQMCDFSPQQSAFSSTYEFDFSDIKGQELAKRSLQIAAAGFHNVHLSGSPGSGKTMLCRAFPSILPPLTKDESLEVSKIYSAVGILKKGGVYDRPFRSPHHTTSQIGLIGGGALPKPGEISLAHRGVLFLDEIAEFPRSTLESLRQPMEDGSIVVSRASGSLTFPCRFLFLAASNPCQCGYFGSYQKKCSCSSVSVLLYKKKLSGPLIDRIDIHVNVLPVEESKLNLYFTADSSIKIKEAVITAQERQNHRFSGTRLKNNSEMLGSDVKDLCKLTIDASDILKKAVSRLKLSARSYFKVIKVAQTIADLNAKDAVEAVHISEALQYRAKRE